MTELPAPVPHLQPLPLLPIAPGSISAEDVLDDFLRGRNARTLAAYGADLRVFARTLGFADNVRAAVKALLGNGRGHAQRLLFQFRSIQQERGLKPSTINRRLSALRSLLALAHDLGLIEWSARIKGLRAITYKDVRGPGRAGVRAMLAALEGKEGPIAVRDRAILRLLYDRGLRRAEVVGLDLADLEIEQERVWVLMKGEVEKQAITLPAPTIAALRAWLAIRGPEPGPLILNYDPTHKAKTRRLTGGSVWRQIHALGFQAGVGSTRPHGLRHAAITDALDRMRGDVRAVRSFSRHKSIQNLLRYDDARTDQGGQIAKLVAEGLGEEDPPQP